MPENSGELILYKELKREYLHDLNPFAFLLIPVYHLFLMGKKSLLVWLIIIVSIGTVIPVYFLILLASFTQSLLLTKPSLTRLNKHYSQTLEEYNIAVERINFFITASVDKEDGFGIKSGHLIGYDTKLTFLYSEIKYLIEPLKYLKFGLPKKVKIIESETIDCSKGFNFNQWRDGRTIGIYNERKKLIIVNAFKKDASKLTKVLSEFENKIAAGVKSTIQEFAQRQKAKGLIQFKGDKWGTPEQVKKWKEIELGIDKNFSNLSPFQFEEFVAKLFNRMGYKTTITRKTGDFGIDVIAKSNKDTLAIQVKQNREGNNIGAVVVQNVLGSMWRYKTNKAIIVTTSDFTVQAKEQAKEAPIELWNKRILHELVRKYFIEDAKSVV